MKGLFIKDLILFKNQAKFYIMFTIICTLMLFANFNPAYIIGYMTLMCMMFTFTTISYDEFENGFSFLFTLPYSRRDYVREKYGFGILVSLTVWILFLAVVFIKSLVGKNMDMGEILPGALMYLFVVQLFCAVNLPIQFKFGIEKGRIALFGVSITIFAVVFVIAKLFELNNLNITAAFRQLGTIRPAPFFVILACICAVIYGISYCFSVKIMEKRQF